MKQLTAFLLGLTALASPACAQSVAAIPANLQPEVAAALEKISPDSIRSVMSFLASDLRCYGAVGLRGLWCLRP